jgi:SAM-dependent methyltransferase
MCELARENPTGRFSGLADIYARYRPDYPPAALDFVVQHCRLGPGAVLVDVGCGTGISSRLFAERGLTVIGIEPNADMRRRAEAESAAPGGSRPSYREGKAEATGLSDVSADAVLAAQAFHWFEPAAALREFQRILKPDGWAVLLWNERDESDPFTAAYGEIIRSARGAAAVEVPRSRADEPLLHSALFQDAERTLFQHQQTVDEEGLLGRSFSASYAPREPAEAETFAAALRAVFTRFRQAGKVVLQYRTSVTSARRR